MKVMCVTNKYHVNPQSPVIEVGCEVAVVDTKSCFKNGLPHYRFAEMPPVIIGIFRYTYWYDARGFATLPSTTEEIAVEHEREAIVNLETAAV